MYLFARSRRLHVCRGSRHDFTSCVRCAVGGKIRLTALPFGMLLHNGSVCEFIIITGLIGMRCLQDCNHAPERVRPSIAHADRGSRVGSAAGSRGSRPSTGLRADSAGARSPSARTRSPSAGARFPSAGARLPSAGAQSPSSAGRAVSARALASALSGSAGGDGGAVFAEEDEAGILEDMDEEEERRLLAWSMGAPGGRDELSPLFTSSAVRGADCWRRCLCRLSFYAG